MLLISSLVWLPASDQEASIAEWWWVLDLVLGAAAYVAVFWRRRHPLGIAVALAIVSAVSGTAGGPAVLAAVSLATRRRWREIALVGSLSFAAAQLYSTWTAKDSDPRWLILAANAIATGAM